MKVPEDSIRRVFGALAAVILIAMPVLSQPKEPAGQPMLSTVAQRAKSPQELERLANGNILVDCQDIGGTKYVVAREWVDEPAANIWPILVNPYEFAGSICHNLKRVEILTDLPDVSLMDCTVSVIPPLPDLEYKVESHYTAWQRVDFHRVSGSFKDFRGFWELEPAPDGKTEIIYSLYLDPGMPLPDWLVQQAERHELPLVLSALRDRLNYLKQNTNAVQKHTIMAAYGCGHGGG
jgi:hypothetical protein